MPRHLGRRPLRCLPSCPLLQGRSLTAGASSGLHLFIALGLIGKYVRSFAQPEATSLFVILIPIIAGRVHATRAPCAARDPKFRPALLRRLLRELL